MFDALDPQETPMPKNPTDAKVVPMPDGPPDATGLTPRQQRVLATIKDAIEQRGYPPSMREIGQARAGSPRCSAR